MNGNLRRVIAWISETILLCGMVLFSDSIRNKNKERDYYDKKYDRLWKGRGDYKRAENHRWVKIRQSQISGSEYQNAKEAGFPWGRDPESYEDLYAAW